MAQSSLKLKMCTDENFFEILEKCVEFRVPSQLKNILILNSLNSAVALASDIKQTITDIEYFMQNDLKQEMLKLTENMSDYLGIFATDQKNFQLLSGQKRMLTAICEYCLTLYPSVETPKMISGSAIQPPIGQLHIDSLDLPATYVPSLVPTQGSFCHTIAKRILSKKF